jgi:DNA gyrase/topoisomerase IV subunit A
MYNNRKHSRNIQTLYNNGKNSNFIPLFTNFQYKPPNNTGTNLALIGGVLTTVGDALAIIGTIIQLNTDTAADFQSQVDDYIAEQEQDNLRDEVEELQEKIKQIEELLKNNQT